MARNSLPVSGQDLCCAGELDLSRSLPQVPSPVPGGRLSDACSCRAVHCVFGNAGLCSHLFRCPRREMVVQFELDAGRFSAQ